MIYAMGINNYNRLNTLRSRQNGRSSADSIFKLTLWNKNVYIFIQISLEFVPRSPIDNKSGSVKIMMTSSNENIFRVTGHLCGEFTGPGEFPAQRPVTRSFGVFFDLSLNKRLSKQLRGWWFGTQSRPLWRHCNDDEPKVNLLFWCIYVKECTYKIPVCTLQQMEWGKIFQT